MFDQDIYPDGKIPRILNVCGCYPRAVWAPEGSVGRCAPWAPSQSLSPGCSLRRSLLTSAFFTAWNFITGYWGGRVTLSCPQLNKTCVGLEPGTWCARRAPKSHCHPRWVLLGSWLCWVRAGGIGP